MTVTGARFLQVFIHVMSWLPFCWLSYAVYTENLGGDPQEALLHELGQWGLIFLLCGLALTPIRRLFGVSLVMRWRRPIGLYAAFYLFLHLLAFYFFYLGADWSEFWHELKERPYITLGMLAFVMLLPLVVTSTRAAQRALGSHWKKLHQSVYWIVGLGLIHFIWQSKSDLNQPLWYVLIFLVLMFARKVRLSEKA